LSPSRARTRASTRPHRGNGLACRSSDPNRKPGPLSVQRRWGMRTVSPR
jgi:hypothetical protein